MYVRMGLEQKHVGVFPYLITDHVRISSKISIPNRSRTYIYTLVPYIFFFRKGLVPYIYIGVGFVGCKEGHGGLINGAAGP